MSVTIHPSTTPCGSDPEKLRERLDEIQLCETFNAECSSGIESPRRTRLLERLRIALPAMRDCLLDLKVVVQGERSRYEQAVERILAQHPELTPITDDVWDQIDPATAGVWDCCDALTYHQVLAFLPDECDVNGGILISTVPGDAASCAGDLGCGGRGVRGAEPHLRLWVPERELASLLPMEAGLDAVGGHQH